MKFCEIKIGEKFVLGGNFNVSTYFDIGTIFIKISEKNAVVLTGCDSGITIEVDKTIEFDLVRLKYEVYKTVKFQELNVGDKFIFGDSMLIKVQKGIQPNTHHEYNAYGWNKGRPCICYIHDSVSVFVGWGLYELKQED